MTIAPKLSVGSRVAVPFIARHTNGCWETGDVIECVSVVNERPDIKTFTFKDPAGRGFRFKPGQHISLLLPMNAGEDYRTFTIASAPTRPDTISVTVKKNRPDHGTDWMHNSISVGTQLIAHGPFGHFNLAEFPAEKLLLVSAGVGITPMMSMIRWLADREEAIDITFVHYASTKEGSLFSEELAEISDKLPNMKLRQILTREDDGTPGEVLSGRPSKKQMEAFVDLSGVEIFCCGPNGFMDALRSIVEAATGSTGHYHQESFFTDNEAVAIAPLLEQQEADQGVVRVSYKGKEFDVSKGSLLLDALRKNKFVLPVGCKSGKCGTCRLKVDSGQVSMMHQGGLTGQEEKEGYVLACCSTVQSNLSIS